MEKLLNIEVITPSQKKKTLAYLLTRKINNYVTSITFLTDCQWKKFKDRCLGKKIHEKYVMQVNYKDYKTNMIKHPYIIFLTKNKQKII